MDMNRRGFITLVGAIALSPKIEIGEVIVKQASFPPPVQPPLISVSGLYTATVCMAAPSAFGSTCYFGGANYPAPAVVEAQAVVPLVTTEIIPYSSANFGVTTSGNWQPSGC